MHGHRAIEYFTIQHVLRATIVAYVGKIKLALSYNALV